MTRHRYGRRDRRRASTTTGWNMSTAHGHDGVRRRIRFKACVLADGAAMRCTLPDIPSAGGGRDVAPPVSHDGESARCELTRRPIDSWRRSRSIGDDTSIITADASLGGATIPHDEYDGLGRHDDALQDGPADRDSDRPGERHRAQALSLARRRLGWKLLDDDREQHRDDLHRHDRERESRRVGLPATNTALANQVRVAFAIGGVGRHRAQGLSLEGERRSRCNSLATIADNTTTTITDTTPDARLGAAPPAVGYLGPHAAERASAGGLDVDHRREPDALPDGGRLGRRSATANR